MISPTQRTLLHLRRHGALAATVERWNAFVVRPGGGRGVRMDLWRFADIIAVDDQPGVLFIQACRTDDMATRETKMRSEKVWPNIERVLAAKNRVRLVGWAKRGEQKRWTMSAREITCATR